MWKTKIEKLTYQNSNILSLNVFQVNSFIRVKFYDKVDLEMRNLYSKLNRKNTRFTSFKWKVRFGCGSNKVSRNFL